MAQQAMVPHTLLQAIRYFSDQDVCLKFVAELRWRDGPYCPACATREVRFIATRRFVKLRGSRGKSNRMGPGGLGRVVVMGLLERKGEVRAKVIKDFTAHTLQQEIRNQVRKGSQVYTDALTSYRGLSFDYFHRVIDHAE